MKKPIKSALSRRKFVQLAAIASPTLALVACGEQPANNGATAPTGQPATSIVTNPAPATTAGQTLATATPATTAAQATATIQSATTTQAASVISATQTAGAGLVPTPMCSSKPVQTMAEEEGPYFKPSSPQRTSLLTAGLAGTKLIVSGYVLSTDCQPVKNALLDFWQANDSGQYDLQGFTLRGHQYTDETGRFYLETIVPGLYPGRTRHIHVKVQAPNQSILTTQLYFPGEPRNQTDHIFNQALLLQMQDNAANKEGLFNFVLKLA